VSRRLIAGRPALGEARRKDLRMDLRKGYEPETDLEGAKAFDRDPLGWEL
jgi:hypothetical protein